MRDVNWRIDGGAQLDGTGEMFGACGTVHVKTAGCKEGTMSDWKGSEIMDMVGCGWIR